MTSNLLSGDSTAVESTILEGDTTQADYRRPFLLRGPFPGDVTLHGLTIRNATLTDTIHGAGVRSYFADLYVRHCNFSNNQALRGPAIAVHVATIQLHNNVFTQNHAIEIGGSVVGTQCYSDIQYNTFIGNTCDYDVGCLIMAWSDGIIRKNRFIGNQAFQFTGAVSIGQGGHWIVEENLFRDNHASEAGAFYVGFCDTLIVHNNRFERNAAIIGNGHSNWGAGGAFWVAECDHGDVSDNLFIDNTADYAGGAIYLASTLDLHHNQFINNRGRRSGAIEVMNVNQAGPDPFGSYNVFVDNGPIAGMEEDYAGAVRGTAGTTFTLSECDFKDNRGGAAAEIGLDPLQVVGNYWGHPSGPFVSGVHETGMGDTLAAGILFEPFSTVPHVLPYIQLSDSTCDFGLVEPGSTAVRSVTLTNPNAMPLIIHDLRCDSTAFLVEFNDPLMLEQGDSTVVTLQFMPDQPGVFNGELTIHSNDATDTVRVVHLLGIGAGTGVEGPSERSELPVEFRLERPHPNPFNPSLNIRVGLPRAGKLRLEVYNLLGERVAVPAEDVPLPAGWHSFTFHAQGHASGTYLIHARLPGERTLVQKAVLVK